LGGGKKGGGTPIFEGKKKKPEWADKKGGVKTYENRVNRGKSVWMRVKKSASQWKGYISRDNREGDKRVGGLEDTLSSEGNKVRGIKPPGGRGGGGGGQAEREATRWGGKKKAS